MVEICVSGSGKVASVLIGGVRYRYHSDPSRMGLLGGIQDGVFLSRDMSESTKTSSVAPIVMRYHYHCVCARNGLRSGT